MMSIFTVCKVAFTDRGTPMYVPIGFIDGADRAVEFNNLNINDPVRQTPFIAMYGMLGDGDYSGLPMMDHTKKIYGVMNQELDSGEFYDIIKNTSTDVITLSSFSLKPGESRLVFLNEAFHTTDYGMVMSSGSVGALSFMDGDRVVDTKKALRRYTYTNSVVSSYNRSSLTGKLKWHQYVGQEVILAFRKDMARANVTAQQSVSILTKMMQPNILMINGQLEVGALALSNVPPDRLVTAAVLDKYIKYIYSVDYKILPNMPTS